MLDVEEHADCRSRRRCEQRNQQRALSPHGDQRECEHEYTEDTGDHPVHLFAPGEVRHVRAIRKRGIRLGDVLLVAGPGRLAIAGWPVRA